MFYSHFIVATAFCQLVIKRTCYVMLCYVLRCAAVVANIDSDFIYDYRLTHPPHITNRFIETKHKVTACHVIRL